MIKVKCVVDDYTDYKKKSLVVSNHWNDCKMVELDINGEKITVLGYDIIEAVKNCMNTNMFG